MIYLSKLRKKNFEKIKEKSYHKIDHSLCQNFTSSRNGDAFQATRVWDLLQIQSFKINNSPAVLSLRWGSLKKREETHSWTGERADDGLWEPYNMTPWSLSDQALSRSCRVYGSSRRACFSWRCLMAIFSGPGGRKSDKKRRHSWAHVQRLSALVGPHTPFVVFTRGCAAGAAHSRARMFSGNRAIRRGTTFSFTKRNCIS